MRNETRDQTAHMDICIIGNNAKSVAAATALTHLGCKVALYALSENEEQYLENYKFDKYLCDQWRKSIDEQLLTYHNLNVSDIENTDFKHYWLFLDQIPESMQEKLVLGLSQSSRNILLSGIEPIGRIDQIANQLSSANVFYIPFVFLNQASVYLATIAPSLLLVGEKSLGTAAKNLIIQKLIENSEQSHIHDVKTVEFARSCMMNLMASKLSLLNEMAQAAEGSSVDMLDVEAILQLDKRLGEGFLKSGWGYGGSTLPKENVMLKQHLKGLNLPFNMIEEVEKINNEQKELIFQKIWRYFGSYISGKKVVIWGAGYKRGTGRTKGSAIHTLLPLFWGHDVVTLIYDPLAEDELNEIYKQDSRLEFLNSPYEHLDTSDAVIIINWSEDNKPDINVINQYQTPVFDARNLLSREQASQLNGYYTGIGHGK
ncbi:UDP binding domain-containing protein [uncultured Psychrobacter sp.]|uniref:UDP binding domain-containing protein n=1 Tax=uncultured Psychrobacter sp. TaxID=259303 RepID=UPI0025932EE2|nr:UDP binding domain-containing protein [uncultured Psychrobacter sp.]